jgi:hypothetical protein
LDHSQQLLQPHRARWHSLYLPCLPLLPLFPWLLRLLLLLLLLCWLQEAAKLHQDSHSMQQQLQQGVLLPIADQDI